MRVDLIKHAFIGAGTSIGFVLLHKLALAYGPIPAMILAAGLLGLAYELLQSYLQIGDPSAEDAMATFAGGAILSAIYASCIGVIYYAVDKSLL